MLKYAIWLSLAWAAATLVQASPAALAVNNQRSARSIWPFSSSEPANEPLISEENAQLLEQAGLDKTFNLSSHPLWKIHKYQGIDLKPVHIQTEIIKPTTELIDARAVATGSPISAQTTENLVEDDNATTEEPVDLSFLDDLGGLAYFLPEPKDDEDFSDEATDLIAAAIKKEEDSHPGFFRKLWWKLWGGGPNQTEVETSSDGTVESADTPVPESTSQSSGFFSSLFGFGQSTKSSTETKDTLTIYLPETQGTYVAVVLPSEQLRNEIATGQGNVLLPGREAQAFGATGTPGNVPKLFEALPANHANQFRETLAGQAGAVASPIHERPVARRPVSGTASSEFNRSQAWIQSWNPHASYSVHVQGPADNPQQHEGVVLRQDVIPVLQPLENSQDNDVSYQRKISHDDDEDETIATTTVLTTTEAQTQENLEPVTDLPISSTETSTTDSKVNIVSSRRDDQLERARDILSNFNLPTGLMKRLQVSEQDVDAILNNKESAARAADRLRALQREFEMRKEQLSYAYSKVRKQRA